MNSRLQNKSKAIELRKNGFSYKEIMTSINVSKGTLSGWMKNIELTEDQIQKIYFNSNSRQNNGRYKAVLTNKAKKIIRIEIVRKESIEEFEKYKNDVLFLIGLSLYWAEGSKRDSSFSFINSDPNMIKFMFFWTQKYLKIDKKLFKIRLFIHLPFKDEKLEEYWSNIIDVEINSFQRTVYKTTPHSIKKNPSYKGCLRFYLNGIYYLRKVTVWQELLVKYLKI